MFRIIISLLFATLLLISCKKVVKTDQLEVYKAELINVEKEFAQMAKEEGVASAFLAFAAKDATISRGDMLFHGLEGIQEYFDRQTLKNVELDWEPDFVDVSTSGDLGYTYGDYVFSAIDANGDTLHAAGVFHTVWKRQEDGNWRFVWD